MQALAVLIVASVVGLLSGPVQDGEQAADIGRAFATGMGLKSGLALESAIIADDPLDRSLKAYHVGYSFADDPTAWASASIRIKTGAVTAFSVHSARKVKFTGDARSPASTARAWNLVNRVRGNTAVALSTDDQLGVGEDGRLSATFYVLVNGLRFLNQGPLYAFMINFNAVNPYDMLYYAPPTIPPVPGPKPRLSSNAANEKVISALERAQLASAAKQQPQHKTGFKMVADSTLGYYHVQTEKTGRLVWEVHSRVLLKGVPYKFEICHQRTWVDANSGQIIETVQS